MEHLRDKTRQYTADQTAAIKLNNQAAGVGDLRQTINVVSSALRAMAKNVGAEESAAESQAKKDLSNAQTEATAKILEYQNKYGENAASPENQEVLKQELATHFSSKRGNYKYDSASAVYDTGMDDFINRTVAANHVYATKARIERTAKEKRAAASAEAAAAKQFSEGYGGVAVPFIQQAGQLGLEGDIETMSQLTEEVLPALGEMLEGANLTPLQREIAIARTLEGAVQNNIVQGLSSPREDVRLATNLALNDQAEFERVIPASYINNHVGMAARERVRDWEFERTRLKHQIQDLNPDSPAYKTAQERIDALDEQIQDYKETGAFADQENWEAGQKKALRETLRDTVSDYAKQQLGKQELQSRMAAFEEQKKRASHAATDPFDNSYLMDVEALAKEEQRLESEEKRKKTLGMVERLAAEEQVSQSQDNIFSGWKPQDVAELYVNYAKDKQAYFDDFANSEEDKEIYKTALEKVESLIDSGLTVEEAANAAVGQQMTPVQKNEDGSYSAVEEPQMSYIGGKKPKGFWTEYAADLRGYRDAMSEVSMRTRSTYETKSEVIEAVRDLMRKPITNEDGDPVDFEKEGAKVLHAMARLPLTEDERVKMSNLIGQLLLSNNEQVQQLRALFDSGDVGFYVKSRHGGAKGDGSLEDGGIGRAIDYKDEALESFDKKMWQAQIEYQSRVVEMVVDGASYEEIMAEKKKIFTAAVDDFYRGYMAVDLRPLREKVENKQPAFQRINNIVYEYKGDDPFGAPIWLDHGRLDTNRSFHNFFEKSKFVDMNPRTASKIVKQQGVKAEDVAKEMGAENE